MIKFIHCLFFILVQFLFSEFANGQVSKDNTNNGALNLYLNCTDCPTQFIKTEITFVNYVRDRKEADVDLLITSQETGSGGDEITLNFSGQGRFSGMNDTLMYIANSTNTEDETRKGLTEVIKLGLVHYVAKTPLAGKISISYKADTVSHSGVPVNPQNDPWKSWVFGINCSGYFNGQQSSSTNSIYGSISANKVTDKWKIELSVNGDYNEQEYIVDPTVIKSSSNGKSVDGKIVRSLSQHWSIGIIDNAGTSTYNNKKLYTSSFGGIEYNIFPYSQCTRRQLRIGYYGGYVHHSYNDTTIYEETSEDLLKHTMDIGLDVTQPWGSVYISVSGSVFTHDLSKNHLSAFGSINLKIFKGLSFRVGGSYAIIHDQLSLPKGGATEEEVLLHRKELATAYSYYISTGISFQFGSIYNNCVNTRFGGNRSFYF